MNFVHRLKLYQRLCMDFLSSFSRKILKRKHIYDLYIRIRDIYIIYKYITICECPTIDSIITGEILKLIWDPNIHFDSVGPKTLSTLKSNIYFRLSIEIRNAISWRVWIHKPWYFETHSIQSVPSLFCSSIFFSIKILMVFFFTFFFVEQLPPILQQNRRNLFNFVDGKFL